MSEIQGGNIITNGLVLHLDSGNPQSFDGNSTIWRDLSGNGNNGTLVNGVSYSNTNRGVMVFDGVNDYVNLVNSNNIIGNNLQTLTASVWVKYSTTAMGRLFVLARNNTTSSLIALVVNETVTAGTIPVNTIGAIGFFNRNSADTAFTDLTYNDNYHLKNRWINLTCVVDGTNRYLYVDGQLVNSDIGVGIQSVTGNTGVAVIGTQIGATGEFYNGQLNDLYYYRRALNGTEIIQNYNATKNRFGL